MKENNFSNKVISGLLWKFSERMAAQIVTFIVTIVLARLITPEEYGVIALITIFITIANVFVVSGFGNALIQKKDADNIDFSSVFYFNIIFSLFIYFVIFTIAPYVARFYDMDILKPVLRILALKIVLAGINSIQQAYVSRKMMFRKVFISTLIGTIVSAFVGIGLAISGAGVWALVAQQLSNALLDTIILWIIVKWRPILIFDFSRVVGLIKYGWKILATNLVNAVYDNLKNLIIGKKYSSIDLAYYSKGKQFPELFVTNINSAIGSVLFPAMALIQDDKQRLKESIRKSIMISSFIMLPLMAGLFVVADDVVTLLLTDTWSFCVPYLRIACIYLSTYPINTANLQALNAIGRSDYYLKLELIKRSVGIILIVITMNYGVFWIASSDIIVTIFAIIINTYPNSKILNYSLIEQIKDLVPNIIRSLVMAIIVYIVNCILKNYIDFILIRLIIDMIIGAIIYISLSFLTNAKELKIILEKVKLLRK